MFLFSQINIACTIVANSLLWLRSISSKTNTKNIYENIKNTNKWNAIETCIKKIRHSKNIIAKNPYKAFMLCKKLQQHFAIQAEQGFCFVVSSKQKRLSRTLEHLKIKLTKCSVNIFSYFISPPIKWLSSMCASTYFPGRQLTSVTMVSVCNNNNLKKKKTFYL